MKRRLTARWLLACSVAACATVASAGPEECLTLRDNPAVATCANKYAPGTFPLVNTSPRHPPRIEHQPVQTDERWMVYPVPTTSARPVAQIREAPEVVENRDRSELIYRSELGAMGLAAMGLVFGVWKWQTSTVRRCAFCGTRAAEGSSVCKRCFRSV